MRKHNARIWRKVRLGLKIKKIEDISVALLRKAAIFLPADVKNSLKKAYETETSYIGKSQLQTILKNIDAAERLERPVCQDTGIISFFIRGKSIDYDIFRKALVKATVTATEEIPLRSNAVHPLTRKNSGDNTGILIPEITWLYDSIDYTEITAVLKGAGSENMTVLSMLSPGKGIKGIKKAVLEAVAKAGGRPCPPTIINIGIGGTVDLTFKLAKLAMIRPLGSVHLDKNIEKLEKEIFELVNLTGIGPMGLGGKITTLDVKIEYAYCHTASLPIGLNFQCWADRRASAKIYQDGSFEIV